MQLKDIARRLPDDVWAVFAPILPPRVWCGNGRKPYTNQECLHALLYVLAAGIAWEMLPPCFPSPKTVQRRLQEWLAHDISVLDPGLLVISREVETDFGGFIDICPCPPRRGATRLQPTHSPRPASASRSQATTRSGWSSPSPDAEGGAGS